MTELAVLLLGSYLLGAIPWGLVVGLTRGVDVRRQGSGMTGATNTLRAMGLGASALVFAADIAKGALPVLAARFLLHSQGAEVAAALAAIAGHNWSVYIGFRGGRGVSTSLGGLIAMSPVVGLAVMALGLGVIASTRYASLGSLTGSTFAPLILMPLVLLGREPLAYLVYALLAAVLVVVQHRGNIVRLRSGTERRLGGPPGS